MINEVHSMVTQRQLSKWNPCCVGCGSDDFTSNRSNGFTLNGSNGLSSNGSGAFTSNRSNGFTTQRDVKVQRGNFSLSNSSHKPARTIQQLSSLCLSIFLPIQLVLFLWRDQSWYRWSWMRFWAPQSSLRSFSLQFKQPWKWKFWGEGPV